MFILDLEVRYYNDGFVSTHEQTLRTWSIYLNELKFSGDYWVTQLQRYEVERRYSIRELIPDGRGKVVYNSWE